MANKFFAQKIDENKIKEFKRISQSTGIGPARLLEMMFTFFEKKNIQKLEDFVHLIEK